MSLEVPAEVRLIVESNICSGLNHRLTAKQPLSSCLDTTRDDVLVRSDSICALKNPDELRRRQTEASTRARQSHRFE